jgi:chemotaxis response regulator CheB
MHTKRPIEGDVALTAVEGCGDAIRVLVCDDSPTHAAALRRCLERGSGIHVVAVLGRVAHAIGVIPDLRPDLVLLDLELPGLDGVAAVERIANDHALPVVVFSSRTRRGAQAAMAARAAGAMAAYSKSDLDLADPDGLPALVFRRRLTMLAQGAGASRPLLRLA